MNSVTGNRVIMCHRVCVVACNPASLDSKDWLHAELCFVVKDN